MLVKERRNGDGKGVDPIPGLLSTKARRKEGRSQGFHSNINNFQPPRLIRRLKSIPNLPENYLRAVTNRQFTLTPVKEPSRYPAGPGRYGSHLSARSQCSQLSQ